MIERSLVLPSQTSIVSDRDRDAARKLRDQVVALVESRAQYIARHRIDRDFAHADGIWANNIIVGPFRRIARCDDGAIGNLRANCHFFTGHALYDVRTGRGTGVIDDASIYTDQMVAGNLEDRNEPFVTHWAASTLGTPIPCLFSPPRRFGEIGEEVDGIIVNHDTAFYQERLNLIHSSGLFHWLQQIALQRGEVRVVEIGGGYGAVASWVKTTFPNCSYTIVDLPEALLFPALYLGLSRPDARVGFGLDPVPLGFRFVPNYMAENLDERFDLVINTLSLSEMSELQIRRYGELISQRWIADGGVFFEQNQDNTSIGHLCAQEILVDFFPHRQVPQLLQSVIQTQGAANIWGVKPLPFTAMSVGEPLSPPALVEAIGTFNIIRYGGKFYALPQSGGEWNWRRHRPETLPGALFAETLDELRAQIRAPSTDWDEDIPLRLGATSARPGETSVVTRGAGAHRVNLLRRVMTRLARPP